MVLPGFEYTRKAAQNIQRVYDSEFFDEQDSEEIFQYLSRNMPDFSFSDQLKRYIYNTKMKEDSKRPFEEVTDKEYVKIIIDSFKDSDTDFSWQQTTAKPGATVRKWLSGRIVKRDTVLLLGFGLGMTYSTVSEFLTKYIFEEDFKLQNHFEAICFHCLWNHKNFQAAQEYLHQYDEISEEDCRKDAYSEAAAQQLISDVQDRRALLSKEPFLIEYLHALKARYFRSLSADAASESQNDPALKSAGQVKAQQEFRRLYQEACTSAYEELSASDEDWQRKGRTVADVTSGTLEKMLCSGIPVNSSGNLEKNSASRLGKAFNGYRMSRQRIDSLLKGKGKVERADLITLEFFIFALDRTYDDPTDPNVPVKRLHDFWEEMERVLKNCEMFPFYLVNPYESFIAMCTVTGAPLDTYNSIWEYSYDTDDTEE